MSEDFQYTDHVNLYAKWLMSLGCFYLKFSDSIRESDGDRDVRCWRYMLPMFISSGRKNYDIEAFHLLLPCDFLLSPRQAAELVWSRFVKMSQVFLVETFQMIYTWSISTE